MGKVYKGKYFTIVFKISEKEANRRFTAMVQEFYDRYYKDGQTTAD